MRRPRAPSHIHATGAGASRTGAPTGLSCLGVRGAACRESAGGAGGETNVTFWLVLFAVALTLYTLYYNYHARKHEAGKAAQETLSADW